MYDESMVRFLLSLFASVALASEGILSPLADDQTIHVIMPPKPAVSFGALTVPAPTPVFAVLGAQTEQKPFSVEEAATEASPAPLQTTITKRNVTIAVLGDSMVDTLGPGVPHLASRLKARFPSVTFTIHNYGVGATNIDYGIERITNGYTYLGSDIPSLVSRRPDIVVVESFGYNPYSFDTGALDKHWLAMARAVDILREHLPGVKIIIAATIAPSAKTFGDGAPGLSFDPVGKQEKVTVIKKYLENAIHFAQSQHLPLADAYHPSLGADGNGKETYINQGDHIHYSDAGRALFAQKVTEAIVYNNLIR